MENIRELLGFKQNYSSINREERNLAALFYYALLRNNNIENFIRLLRVDSSVIESEVGVYFEYAFLRDVWSNVDANPAPFEDPNDTKRRAILELLKPGNAAELEAASILDFNSYFGAVPLPSDKHIQSPGNWSILGNKRQGVRGYNENVHDDNEFLRICRFKWSFNIKPDIVIHTSRETAICIEAKLESHEGQYPSKPAEKAVFASRGLDRVDQTSLQQYMMTELVGLDTEFVFLVADEKMRSDTHTTLTWKAVFGQLDTSDFHPFVLERVLGL